MSINILTSELLKRDVDAKAMIPGTGGSGDSKLAAGRPRFRVRHGGGEVLWSDPVLGASSEDVAQSNTVTGSLNLLVKYIPTEVITLYVATLSAAPALQDVFPNVGTNDIYWGFTIITPLLLFLVYVNKRATSGLRPIVPQAREWPWWKLFAATVAFMVWALAVPGNPYVPGETAAVLAALGAVFISMLLNLLEPVFERKTAQTA